MGREECSVKVVRDSQEQPILVVPDAVVGDFVLLKPSEIIPCDGVFFSGHYIRSDESNVTGESNAIKKPYLDNCCSSSQAP
jgi:Ca2+-transporting ATPase